MPSAVSIEEKRKSLEEWRQMTVRYPLRSPWDLVTPGMSALVGNGLTAWFVASGRMTPLELVVLVVLEALMLGALAWAQLRFVPAHARPRNPAPVGQRLFTLVFGLAWLGGVYGIVFGFFVPQGEGLSQLLADPLAFITDSELRWPLLTSLAGALADARRDREHFASHGGQFLSTPGFNALARVLTLLLGGIPFAVPLFALVIAINFFIEKLHAWTRSRQTLHPDNAELAVILLVPLFGIGVFAVFGALITAGASGWAVGYCCAKFAAELFVVCIPLIAHKAHAEESAALTQPESKVSRR